MSRLGTHVRFALVLTVGIVAGFGLSIGRTVKAEREIEPEPPTHRDQRGCCDSAGTVAGRALARRSSGARAPRVRRPHLDRELIEARSAD
jgi:hypothetical protein